MRKWLAENRGFLIFLLAFGVFRTAIADYNPVPSGSMRPTIVEGDVVLVNRLAYDAKLPLTDVALVRLGDPRRGDVVTFASPGDGTRLIKRIVALPGDTVAMHDDVLFVNGERARYRDLEPALETVGGRAAAALRAVEEVAGSTRRVQFIDGVPARRSFAAVVVPAEHYFVLGDNRDDSGDSRYIGFVPRRLLIGRAHRVLVSADVRGDWQPRFERWVSPIR